MKSPCHHGPHINATARGYTCTCYTWVWVRTHTESCGIMRLGTLWAFCNPNRNPNPNTNPNTNPNPNPNPDPNRHLVGCLQRLELSLQCTAYLINMNNTRSADTCHCTKTSTRIAILWGGAIYRPSEWPQGYSSALVLARG